MKFYNPLGLPMLVKNGAAFAMVGQSFLARSAFIQLMRCVPFKLESSYLRYTSFCIFWIFFFNYGIIYLVTPFSIEIPFLSSVFTGVYTDFSDSWYQDIGGPIISVALINACMPAVSLVIEWLLNYLLKAFDRCRCCGEKEKNRTRKKTLISFKALYGGADFEIHYQYAQMLVIIWVTFLFAPGLPILFPIALFAIFVQYCCNRVALAYFCKRPPVYDLKLSYTML
mmetsp:Transcript_36399/g.44476  ORF Transcript_36399/g.44476 Transcript_36399/m.44476 type:complete len:226 (+) Transcript_36399:2111-2788(+)